MKFHQLMCKEQNCTSSPESLDQNFSNLLRISFPLKFLVYFAFSVLRTEKEEMRQHLKDFYFLYKKKRKATLYIYEEKSLQKLASPCSKFHMPTPPTSVIHPLLYESIEFPGLASAVLMYPGRSSFGSLFYICSAAVQKKCYIH